MFSGAVGDHPMGVEPGSVVDVADSEGNFVARGYYNPDSSIPVRVLTADESDQIDASFIRERISKALKLRREWIDQKTTNAYRVVHGESDGLPGLIVDKYADFLVLQFHTLGMDVLRKQIVEILEELVHPTGIWERSDVGTRRADGLQDFPTGLIAGEEPPDLIDVSENRALFAVDVRRGQKTGFFLDQRENRSTLQAFSRDREVLNCFCYTGGFSVFAARGKAKQVTSVDVSQPAIDLVEHNLRINRYDPLEHPCIAANVFDYLKDCKAVGQKYDAIVVDPPAFVKTQQAIPQATRAYISLNRKAIELLRPGGILVTASCSTQIDYEAFFAIVKHAASAAGRTVQIVKSHLQAVDHPSPVSFPEGRYLKCLFGVAS
ncbi:MAG: rRNA large subunit methyltransferase I [Gemmatimonadetes bacterium]|nr:rRNA large subunit methyltransferase I [Gemmatimonadota bacterium]HCK09654.1 rRNA large subunit methyltransferase I [Candidatus Latescibacterota bacterium]